MKFKKILIIFILSFLLLSSYVLATEESTVLSSDAPNANNSYTPTTIEKDLYIYNTDTYTLNDIVDGNVFASVNKFTTNSKNNGGIINGNLFLVSSDVTIGSDVQYSNNLDKNGNYIIDSINSKSIINGNVYAVSDSFVINAGAEIHGDLYVTSTRLTIEPNVIIYGNIFAYSNNFDLSGQVGGSVYITSESFNFDFYSSIGKDLYLNTHDATFNGVVSRDASITATNSLVASSDFKVKNNLLVNNSNSCTLAGKITGNTAINSKNLTINNDCSIHGNLNYATQSNTQIPDGVVSGEVSSSTYVEKETNKKSIQSILISLTTLVVYVFTIVFLSRKFTPKALENISEISVKNIAISFGLGFASIIAILFIFLFLIFSGIGITLALFALVAYLFVVSLSIPLFFNKITELLKWKLNSYVKLIIITFAFYLLSFVPYLGGFIVFFSILIGIGEVLLGIFKKK